MHTGYQFQTLNNSKVDVRDDAVEYHAPKY